MQLGTAALFGQGMCRTTCQAPAECQPSKSCGKTRNNFQTTLFRNLPEHSFLSSRCLMFEQVMIRQRVTAAGAWNVTRIGRVVNNKQEWALVTAICIAWPQAGNISQMANCKFLYLRANNWGCSSRMLSGEIMSLWGSEESPANTTNMILWPKVLCVLLVRAGRWLPGWRRDLAATLSLLPGWEGLGGLWECQRSQEGMQGKGPGAPSAWLIQENVGR